MPPRPTSTRLGFALSSFGAVLFVSVSTLIAVGGWPGAAGSTEARSGEGIVRSHATKRAARRSHNRAVTLGGRRPSRRRAAAVSAATNRNPARAATRSQRVAVPAAAAEPVRSTSRNASLVVTAAPVQRAKPKPAATTAPPPPAPATTPPPPEAPDLLESTLDTVDETVKGLGDTVNGVLGQPPAGG